MQYLSNISRERRGLNLIPCLEINIKPFYKLIPLFLLAMARHAQSTQNNKFAVSLQDLKKEGRVELDFMHADKHQIFLQVETINFGGHGQSCPKYPKHQVWKIFAICQESQGWGWFFIQINIKVFYNLITIIFDGCGQTCLKYWK